MESCLSNLSVPVRERSKKVKRWFVYGWVTALSLIGLCSDLGAQAPEKVLITHSGESVSITLFMASI
jgi:hypothetical protein